MFIQQIIRINDDICIIVVIADALFQLIKQIIQRIALADLLFVKAFIDNGAMVARHLRGIVRAVIRNNNRIQKFSWIRLRPNGIQQLTNHTGLISRGNNRRIPIGFDKRLRVVLSAALADVLSDKHHADISHLIYIQNGNDRDDQCVHMDNEIHSNPLSHLSRVLFQKDNTFL